MPSSEDNRKTTKNKLCQLCGGLVGKNSYIHAYYSRKHHDLLIAWGKDQKYKNRTYLERRFPD